MIRECPACKQKVSSEAFKCPHCGHTGPSEQRAIGWVLTLVIMVIVLFIYGAAQR